MKTKIVLSIILVKISAKGYFFTKPLIHWLNAQVLYLSCNRNLALRGEKNEY
jgi:hypothetical protein